VQHLKIHKDLDVSALTSTLPPSPPFAFQEFSDYERQSVSPVTTPSDESSYSASPSPPHHHQTSTLSMGLPEPQYPMHDTFDRLLMTTITMAVSDESADSTGVEYFYDVGAMPQYVQQEQPFNQHSAYSLSPPVPVHYFYQ